jgi:dephospho-CoA kinase
MMDLFQNQFYTAALSAVVEKELKRKRDNFKSSIFVLKTNWLDQNMFGVNWDCILFVDQDPEAQITRLQEFGFDPYTAEQYIDMQFQNVMPAYLNANCIVDNILNITKVLDEI